MEIFFCRILSALICSFHIHNFTPMLPASQGLIFEMTEIIILNQTEKQQLVLLIKQPCNPRITSLMAQTVKHLPTMWETWVRSLGWEDPLEKEMATHSSILARKIPWTEDPHRLHSMGSQTVGQDWATSLIPSRFIHVKAYIKIFFLLRLKHTHTHTQSIVLIHTTTVENSKVVPQKTAIHGSNPNILDDVSQVL